LRNKYGLPKADFSDMDDFVDLGFYQDALESLDDEPCQKRTQAETD
jgi:hypothetical protein